MKRKFKGVIWTDHAISRMNERGISQSDAWYAFRRPDQSRYANTKDAWIYYKDIKDKRIEVVAKKDNSEWVVLSVWSKDLDITKQDKKTSFLKKLIRFFN